LLEARVLEPPKQLVGPLVCVAQFSAGGLEVYEPRALWQSANLEAVEDGTDDGGEIRRR
jgi:hypothetical protein